MITYKIQGIFSRAYYYDVVCICNSKEQLSQAISIMKEWSLKNEMEINKDKSGIMRVLLRKGKCHGIDNTLQIPEVESY